MTTRQKRILIMALIIFLAGLIILLIFLLLKQKAASPTVNENINIALPYNPPINVNSNQGLKIPEKIIAEPPSSDQIFIETLSLNYTEKFGSYSNQSNLSNFFDLLDLSTVAMQNYLNNLINSINNESDENYHGYTTKVLNVEITDLSDGSAETLITTQRQETNESQNILNKVFYQDLKLKLVKNDNQWLVDSAWWQ